MASIVAEAAAKAAELVVSTSLPTLILLAVLAVTVVAAEGITDTTWVWWTTVATIVGVATVTVAGLRVGALTVTVAIVFVVPAVDVGGVASILGVV